MMNNLRTLFGFIILSGILNACHNPDLMPAPNPEWAPVPVVKWTSAAKSFFNIGDIENAEFEFALDGENFGIREAEVSEIDAFISMNGANRKLFRTFNSFPVIVNLPASEAASQFGLSAGNLKAGDRFTFNFVVRTKDGRQFERYGNNICGLIMVKGNCSVDAFVLSPSIAETTVNTQFNNFSKTDILNSGEDSYIFSLTRRDFIDVGITAVNVELSYKEAAGTASPFVLLRSLAPDNITSQVTISASDAAALFGKTASELSAGDSFTIKFTFSTASGSFTNYGSRMCGVNFPSSIVHPFHKGITGTIPDLGFINREFEATAPPATSTSGTCSLTIPVIN